MGIQEPTIDSIDAKIIALLLSNARSRTKDLAKECGLSSTAIGNRIKRLKDNGVIIGSSIIIDMRQVGNMHAASIGIERIGEVSIQKVILLVKRFSNLYVYSVGIGKDDFTIFLVVKDQKILDILKHTIRKYVDGRVSICCWSTPELLFEHICIYGRQ